MFCPHSVKCEKWNNAVFPDGRKCYYEYPQCWKGELDYWIEMVFGIFPEVVFRRLKGNG